MHVGSVPRGVRKITTCKVEPKPNGDVAIGKITKSDIPSTPPTPKISPLDSVSELFSRLSPPKAASAESRARCAVKLWLVDTGCGNDLVDRAEVHALRKMFRLSAKPCNFKTANGTTRAEHEVDIRVDELEETVSPYI